MTLNFFTDLRLGNSEIYYVAHKEESMLVPDEIRECVFFIMHRNKKDGQLMIDGTGFFVSIEKGGLFFVNLVTAKHVIVPIKEDSIDGFAYLRVNTRDGGYKLISTKIDDWINHPSDTSVDCMILPFAPPTDIFDYLSIPTSMFATDSVIKSNSIGAGDEVFMTGLFVNAYGKEKNMPIVRIGNIALLPDEKIVIKHFGSAEVYLIESRSIGGLSGSPAFVHLGGTRTVNNKTMLSGSRFFFFGLVHGHWEASIEKNKTDLFISADEFIEEREAVNKGIAIVIPAKKIMEIIFQERLEGDRDKAIKNRNDKDLPTHD
jgi:hypothetical protein